MKKKIKIGLALLTTSLLLQACSPTTGGISSTTDGSSTGDESSTSTTSDSSSTGTSSDTSESTSSDHNTTLKLEFDFNDGDEDFTADFSDLPSDYNEEIYGLDSGLKPLPEEVGTGQGYFITGMNRSDDLFMFLRKELTAADGIKPNQTYKLHFEIEFASNAFSNSFGIGGSPAESVYVKVGATSEKPESIEVLEGSDPMQRMNIDTGEQSQDGTDAKVIGNIAKQDGSEDDAFAVVGLNSDDVDLSVSSNEDGSIWLIVGTDSGFEGTTELYYKNISVELTPVD